MKISQKVPGWNIDVNKGPWTPKEDNLVGMVSIIILKSQPIYTFF